jgi:hypothetical protein
MITRIIVLLLGLLCATMFAQLDSLQESYSMDADPEFVDENRWEQLPEIPFNINAIAVEQLVLFDFLADVQIQALIAARPFTRKSQVKEILPAETYKMLRPLFVIGPEPRGADVEISSRIICYPDNQYAYQSGKFSGEPMATQTRMRIGYGEALTGAATVQKDAGESNWFDHYSGFLRWQKNNIEIVAGNFNLRFSEGLVLSSPYGSMLSERPVTATSGARFSLAGSATGSEAGNPSGLAGLMRLGSVEVAAAWGRTLYDASFVPRPLVMTGIDISGYHRTETELAKQNLLAENLLQAMMNWQPYPDWRVGMAVSASEFTPPLIRNEASIGDPELRRTYYSFSGSQLRTYSVSAYYLGHENQIGGELASGSGAMAAQLNARHRNGPWSLGAKFWYLGRGYQTLHGRIFSSRSSFPDPATGILLALSGPLNDWSSLHCYYQQEKDLWRGYFNAMPAISDAAFIQMEIALNKKSRLKLRVRSSETDNSATGTESRRQYRVLAEHELSKEIRWRSRLEWVRAAMPDKSGILSSFAVYHDIRYRPGAQWEISGRASFFSVRDYEARVYEFENDVPGAYSMIALSGKGSKFYLMVRYRPVSRLQLRVKYRIIFYDRVESTGSGDSAMPGDSRDELRLQCDLYL